MPFKPKTSTWILLLIIYVLSMTMYDLLIINPRYSPTQRIKCIPSSNTVPAAVSVVAHVNRIVRLVWPYIWKYFQFSFYIRILC